MFSCNSATENHEHLYFTCSFANQVWIGIQSKNGSHTLFSSLAQEVGWEIVHHGRVDMASTVHKLSLAAATNHLWREINRMIFQGVDQDVLLVTAGIVKDVRSCIHSCRNVKNTDEIGFCVWNGTFLQEFFLHSNEIGLVIGCYFDL